MLVKPNKIWDHLAVRKCMSNDKYSNLYQMKILVTT